MDIWLTRCKKEAKCSHCEKPITYNSPMIVGKLWLHTKEGAEPKPLRWVKMFYWHVAREEDQICCWIEQGMAALNQRSLVEVNTAGRKSLLLDLETRQKRLKLLQRRARLVQRMKEEMEKLASDTDMAVAQQNGSWQRVADLGRKIDELIPLMEALGGVPTSWLEEQPNQERLVG